MDPILDFTGKTALITGAASGFGKLLAEELGFTGTPAWITGNRILNGAQGTDALATAIADAAEPS